MSDDDLDLKPTGNELPADLFQLTVSQLKKVAKANNVAVSGTRKADIIFMLKEAGVTDANGVDLKEEPKSSVVADDEKKSEAKSVKGGPDIVISKIAVYSEKNRFSSDFGRIEKGYNIVSPAQKDFWLKFPGVREATPKEVAKYYGVK
jgi:hypothetical protein